MKKILALGSAFVLTLALSLGCSGSKEQAATPAEESTAAATETTETTTEEAPAEEAPAEETPMEEAPAEEATE